MTRPVRYRVALGDKFVCGIRYPVGEGEPRKDEVKVEDGMFVRLGNEFPLIWHKVDQGRAQYIATKIGGEVREF